MLPSVNQRLQTWQASSFASRLWSKDPSLWGGDQSTPELADRLGWLALPETMQGEIDNLAAFAQEVRGEGIRHVVLLGMGGSSLAPEVFQSTFGNAPGFPELLVLDSTHPAAVSAVASRIDPAKTLFLVSSKSGTTTETLSFFYYLWKQVSAVSRTPGRHFVAITDPGTPLVRLAQERAFRRHFEAPPDVGGRYSALTVFGLVPAALIGVDLHRLLDRARHMAEACAPGVPPPENPGLTLGAALGELALAGRDKVTFFASRSLADLPGWIEQLIAESTGKDGKGIVPLAGDPPAPPQAYGDDRVFVCLTLGDEKDEAAALEAAGHPVIRIGLAEKADLGQEFFRWEFAVAAAGAVLGIQPFNQPDVQVAKDLARKAMEKAGKQGADAAQAAQQGDPRQALEQWLGKARRGDYVGLQAYLAPTADTTARLEEIRLALRTRLKAAVTIGYGPRFLHSTGQLHKGGANNGLFLQLVDEPANDVPVPETNYTFGTLIQAQAAGDYGALEQRGRRVLRLHLGKNPAAELRKLVAAIA